MSPRFTLPGLTALFLSAVAVAGCDSPPSAATPVPDGGSKFSCPATDGELALIIGARANSPAPNLPAGVWSLIERAGRAKQKISVYPVDGEPTEAFHAVFPATSTSIDRLNKEYEGFTATLASKLKAVRAKAAEADVLTALTLAGREVGPGGTVIVVDSGLQTVAPLDFRDMLTAEPKDVADFLEKGKVLPDLKDRTVLFIYLGDSADPQPALDKRWSDHVVAIWQEVTKRAGAGCVEAKRDEVGGRKAVTDQPAVSIVPVPAPPEPPGCGRSVWYNSGPVGFLPDKAVFVDEAAALAKIRELAEVLKLPNRKVELIGTTAGRTTPFGKDLSERRAKLVKDHLVRLGVAETRIRAWGAASDWPGREPDIDSNGRLIPGPAARNRSVVVNVECF